MTARDIERFFKALARRFTEPARVLLIGGGSAILQTGARATLDLDVEIQSPDGQRIDDEFADRLITTMASIEAPTGIPIEVATEAQRWSMISWHDYRKHQVLWKRFGSIAVYLLEPEYFTLTKLGRASTIDVRDIIKVMKKGKGSWRILARLCGNALRLAPRSSSQDLFRRQVEHFFRTSGHVIWGARFDPEAAISVFQKSYRRRPTSR